MSLQTPIVKLPRLQPQIAQRFHQLGIETLHDALMYFPFRHEDWRARAPIAELTVGQEVTIEARVTHITSRRAWHRRGLTITDVTVQDDSGGSIHAVWYNLPFLAKSLKVDDQLFLSGTVTTAKSGRLELHNPVYERPSDEPLHERLVPVYRSTEGLSQRQIRLVVKRAVELVSAIPDPLDTAVRRQFDLVDLPTAIAEIHFPATPESAKQAVRRLKFDELLGWQLRVADSVHPQDRSDAPMIVFHETEIRSFVQHLPFSLTNDQRVAAWQVLQDMHSASPMSRLVQGDVGSGKTVVAALVAYNVALNHLQVAFVAPTVVLAQQHWETFINMLGKHDISIALITGSDARIYRSGTEAEVTRTEAIEAINNGTVHIVLGTHALFGTDIIFQRLGLVIVDEQQRFGVDQRQSLLGQSGTSPHFLSLTATPIPRSFALWLTGILHISTITQKPPGRLPITTEVVAGDDRRKVDAAITTTLNRHEQVYVITPLIEESDSLGVRAAVTEHQRLHELLPHARVGLLHGSMPAEERVAILDQFRRHDLDLLVSTTVIEVGVDVPNATLMVVEGAERFGLAQLHQLRGRIGRGDKPSTCLLCSDSKNTTALQRLHRVAEITDGFAIAELDYQERGAGDLYGQRQSGLPNWRLASLADGELWQQVQTFVQGLRPTECRRLKEDIAHTETSGGEFHPE